MNTKQKQKIYEYHANQIKFSVQFV